MVSETYAFLNAGWRMFLNAREYFSTQRECFSTQRGVSQRGVVFRNAKGVFLNAGWVEVSTQKSVSQRRGCFSMQGSIVQRRQYCSTKRSVSQCKGSVSQCRGCFSMPKGVSQHSRVFLNAGGYFSMQGAFLNAGGGGQPHSELASRASGFSLSDVKYYLNCRTGKV